MYEILPKYLIIVCDGLIAAHVLYVGILLANGTSTKNKESSIGLMFLPDEDGLGVEQYVSLIEASLQL